jgi:hypothetical protein
MNGEVERKPCARMVGVEDNLRIKKCEVVKSLILKIKSKPSEFECIEIKTCKLFSRNELRYTRNSFSNIALHTLQQANGEDKTFHMAELYSTIGLISSKNA